MLPNSTERAITIAGIPQSIIECVKQICVVMLEVGPPPGPAGPFFPPPFPGRHVRRGDPRCPWRAAAPPNEWKPLRTEKRLLGDKGMAGDYGLIQVRLGAA